MNKIDLVILAGGKGTRIKQLLINKPKPMAKFNDKYFLEYIIQNFSKYSFKNIFILTGYKSKIIFNKLHGKTYNFTKIICIKEKYPMGTAGALHSLKKRGINNFVLINGDTIFDINLKLLIRSLRKNTIGSLALVKNIKNKSNKLNGLTTNKGILNIKENNNTINGGIYFFKKQIFKYIKNKNLSLEEDVLPDLIRNKRISGKIFKDFFIDIGTPNDFKIAKKVLFNYFRKPAAFLDRDGVINHDYGYVHTINKFKFRNGVIKGLKYLSKKKHYIFVVTNQAGIAKKKFKESDFINLHIKLKNKLQNKNIYFNEVVFSPFHSKAKIKKYRKFSLTRKPGNLLIKKLKKKWHLNSKKSFMIGDKISDQLASKKSGLYFEFAKRDFLKQIKSVIKNINSY